jgi:DNA/RNA-binding protein KIN17
MLVVGEDAKRHIADYSAQFQRDFLTLLRTSHGEKKINANHFYQEYIANKEHIHMNASRWSSLSEFVKFLGREGICRVEEGERGLMVGWVDNSPEALQRQEAIRKKERQDRGDEEREQRAIREMVERANRDAEVGGKNGETDTPKELNRGEGEKIKLAFGTRKSTSPSPQDEVPQKQDGPSESEKLDTKDKVSIKVAPGKPKNVFAAANKKKAGKKEKDGKVDGAREQPKRPMSEAERIMKEGMERKKLRPEQRFKRQRVV